MLLEPVHEIVIKQGVEYNPWRLLYLCQHPIKLLLRSHQRIDMLNRQDFGVLGGGRPGNGRERLAGGIRYQMKVEIAAYAVRHRRHDNLWISVGEGHGFRPDASPAERNRPALSTPHTWGYGNHAAKSDHREYVNSSGTMVVDASQIIDPTALICVSKEIAFFFDAADQLELWWRTCGHCSVSPINGLNTTTGVFKLFSLEESEDWIILA